MDTKHTCTNDANSGIQQDCIVGTVESTPTTQNNKCCDCCEHEWYANVAYFFAVILCCPCICIDKCGGCRETNSTSSNRVNNVGYGIAIGMALR